MLTNSWHSFGTHTRYLHRLFLLRPSYIDTVINDARADRYHRFFEDIILDALWQRRLDHRCSIRIKNNAFPPSFSFSFFLYTSFGWMTLSFSLYNKLSRTIIFVTRWSRQFARDFRFSDPRIISILLQFLSRFFFFLLFDSLKNNDVEKQEQIFEDGDSTISINRFRI